MGTSIENIQFLGKYVSKLGFQKSDSVLGSKSGKSYEYLLVMYLQMVVDFQSMAAPLKGLYNIF